MHQDKENLGKENRNLTWNFCGNLRKRSCEILGLGLTCLAIHVGYWAGKKWMKYGIDTSLASNSEMDSQRCSLIRSSKAQCWCSMWDFRRLAVLRITLAESSSNHPWSHLSIHYICEVSLELGHAQLNPPCFLLLSTSKRKNTNHD